MINKHKFLFILLGIGIGIVFTNIIYSMNPNIEYRELSEEEIIDKARELGMVFIKDNIDISKKKEDIENTGEEEKTEEIEIVVEYGESLAEVSKKLFQAGLIDDIDSFIDFGKDIGIEKHLRVGTYMISPKVDYETLVKVLMKLQ